MVAGNLNGQIENAIVQTQEKAMIEAKANGKMWEKIAKAVNIAIAIDFLKQIDQDQVKYIIDTIFKCALFKLQQKNASQTVKFPD